MEGGGGISGRFDVPRTLNNRRRLRSRFRWLLRVERKASIHVGAKINRDYDLRAHGTTEGNRDGVHDAAVDHVATVTQYGPEQSRHGARSANGVRNLALAQPQLLPRRELGGNRRERERQFRKLAFDELPLKHVEQAVAFDQAAAQSEVEQPDDAFPVERQRPGLQLLEATGGTRGAHHCAHRAPGDEIGRDAVFSERQKHTDVRPAARRTAAKCDSELRSTNHRLDDGMTPSRKRRARSPRLFAAGTGSIERFDVRSLIPLRAGRRIE